VANCEKDVVPKARLNDPGEAPHSEPTAETVLKKRAILENGFAGHDTLENTTQGRTLILLINGHSESIKKRTVVCAATTCRHCGTNVSASERSFAFHGTRPRRFLVMVGSYVCRVVALLARWRCPHCRRTFTDYPPFACPYKAYTLPQMADRAAKYVSDSVTSYRAGVRFARLPIYYQHFSVGKNIRCCSDEIVNLTTVSHTSLFRWVTCLANKTLLQADRCR
jgi:hypothetical protein